MNDLIVKENIEDMIYEVRGHYVMLDSDLARVYDYKDGAKSINKSAKRHSEKFSEEIYFQLTETESDIFWYQAGTKKSNLETRGGKFDRPHVFTLEGIKILSIILRKPTVLTVTLEIEKAFKKLKSENNKDLAIPVSKGENIENLIYEIGGKQVMLDFDLADLYECKNGTKEINQAVKNNLDKFPKSYSWILSDEELSILRSKVLTFEQLSKINNRKYKIRVFTESGTWMLSTILKTEIANRITRKIIDAFVAMRRYLGDTFIEQNNINNQVMINSQNINRNSNLIEQNKQDILENKNDIKLIKEALSKFDNKVVNAIFYAGQLYDAYSLLVDIIKTAKEEVIIIDGYAGKETLDIICKVQTKVILIVRDKSKRSNLSNTEIEKYNEQYNNLIVIRDNSFHDRFIILDREIIYHSGASINQAGTGTFAINILNEDNIKKGILEVVLELINKSKK